MVNSRIETINTKKANTNRDLKQLFLFCIIILIGVFLRDVFELPVNKFIFLLIATMGFLRLNESVVVAFFVFLIPFFIGLPANYIIMAAIVIFTIRLRTTKTSYLIIAPYIFLLLEAIHLFSPLSSIGEFIKFSVYIVIITIILFRRNAKYNNACILLAYGLGVLGAFTIIFINSLRFISFDMIIEKGIRIGNIDWVNKNFDSTSITLTIDQNTLGYFCIVAITSFLVLYHSKKLKAFYAIPLILLTIFYGTLTLSKTFTTVLVLVLLAFFMLNMKFNKNSIKNLLSITLLFTFVFILFDYYFPGITELILDRFKEEDISNGRTFLFQEYNDFMFSNLGRIIFGIGLQNMHLKSEIFLAPHNGPQQVFVAGGIIGVLLIAIWILGMYINSRPNKSYSTIFLIPFISIIIYVQAIQFLSPYIIMLPLIVVFIALRLSDERT